MKRPWPAQKTLFDLRPAQDIVVESARALALSADRPHARQLLVGVAHDQACPPSIRADAYYLETTNSRGSASSFPGRATRPRSASRSTAETRAATRKVAGDRARGRQAARPRRDRVRASSVRTSLSRFGGTATRSLYGDERWATPAQAGSSSRTPQVEEGRGFEAALACQRKLAVAPVALAARTVAHAWRHVRPHRHDRLSAARFG
jgi:hypothetical protein